MGLLLFCVDHFGLFGILVFIIIICINDARKWCIEKVKKIFPCLFKHLWNIICIVIFGLLQGIYNQFLLRYIPNKIVLQYASKFKMKIKVRERDTSKDFPNILLFNKNPKFNKFIQKNKEGVYEIEYEDDSDVINIYECHKKTTYLRGSLTIYQIKRAKNLIELDYEYLG